MANRAIDEGGFTQGVIKEIPSWMLPRGALADASNLIFDIPGIARQRNGVTGLSSTANAFATSLGFVYSQDGTPIEELYGIDGKLGSLYLINKVTGAATNLAAAITANSIVGRPVRHFGTIVFPSLPPAGSSIRQTTIVGGQTTSVTFISGAITTVVANNQTLTLTGADTTTNIKVGGIIQASDGISQSYLGRVVAINTAKILTIWPVPKVTFNTVALGGLLANPNITVGGGACAASFQNRLLIGNTNDFTSVGRTLVTDRRIYYSPLPFESSTSSQTGATIYGATFMTPVFWPDRNWFEVPGADPIVAMEPVNDSELLILTTQGVVVFRGTLATQITDAASGFTGDVSPLNTNAGCLSDLSVQRTPRGIIWASAEGIMAYTGGGKLTDLTEGRIHTEWRRLTRGSSFAIHGAAYARNHYYVSGSSGGVTFCWCYNLDNDTWAFLTGAGTDIFYSTPRPTDPSQVFALRWWAQGGAAPSMTNGQVVRLDSMFAPDVAGQTKVDADGAVVAFSGVSRTITDDSNTERFLRRLDVRSASQMAAASVSVTVGARLDSTDTAGAETVSVGALSNTSVLTITGQSNATPIVITAANHGLQSEDWVDIHGCTPNTAANGRWKITVLSTSTFSLNGSSGNGATSATGDCKRVTDQEFVCSGVDIGQGHYVALASTGTVNRFEWHGLRASVMEIRRGMS